MASVITESQTDNPNNAKESRKRVRPQFLVLLSHRLVGDTKKSGGKKTESIESARTGSGDQTKNVEDKQKLLPSRNVSLKQHLLGDKKKTKNEKRRSKRKSTSLKELIRTNQADDSDKTNGAGTVANGNEKGSDKKASPDNDKGFVSSKYFGFAPLFKRFQKRDTKTPVVSSGVTPVGSPRDLPSPAQNLPSPAQDLPSPSQDLPSTSAVPATSDPQPGFIPWVKRPIDLSLSVRFRPELHPNGVPPTKDYDFYTDVPKSQSCPKYVPVRLIDGPWTPPAPEPTSGEMLKNALRRIFSWAGDGSRKDPQLFAKATPSDEKVDNKNSNLNNVCSVVQSTIPPIGSPELDSDAITETSAATVPSDTSMPIQNQEQTTLAQSTPKAAQNRKGWLSRIRKVFRKDKE